MVDGTIKADQVFFSQISGKKERNRADSITKSMLHSEAKQEVIVEDLNFC